MPRLGECHEVAQRLDIDHDALVLNDDAEKVLLMAENSIGLYQRKPLRWRIAPCAHAFYSIDVSYSRDSASRVRPDFRGLCMPPARRARTELRVRTEPLRRLAGAAGAAVRHDGACHMATALSACLRRGVLDRVPRRISADSRHADDRRPASGRRKR